MNAWHQNDAFWEAAKSALFSPDAWETARAQVEPQVALLRLEPPATILDLACGPGRYALPLARLGFQVTGVDRTKAYLDEARKRASKEELAIEFVLQDMREFRRAGEFDAAVSLLTSFGYFEDPEEDRRVLRNVHESLKPGGVLVIDTIGKEVIGRIYQERDWKELDGETWLYERKIADSWRSMSNRWIRFKDGMREEFSFSHRLFSGAELMDLTIECGFASAEAYGSLDGAPYDHKAGRLVVLARKD